jgi:cobalt-zinc-cadmium efflux system protein
VDSEHRHHHAGRSAPHTHGPSRAADRRYLTGALALIVGFMIVEVIAGGLASSLALLADAGHMFADAGAIAGSVWALELAARPAVGHWTFGLNRAEILSAAANGVTLLVVAVLIGVEGVRRLIHPLAVHGLAVLVVAAVGVVVNLAAVTLLARADRTSLNVLGAFQHLVTDLYGFVATIAAGAVVVATGFDRADPIASLLVATVTARAGVGLLQASARILLEGAPKDFDLDGVRAHLLEPDHVLDVHDLHVWTVTSDLPAVSAHVVIDDSCFLDGHAPRVLDELQGCLAGHFDVEHSTFQLEPASHADHERGAHT